MSTLISILVVLGLIMTAKMSTDYANESWAANHPIASLGWMICSITSILFLMLALWLT